MIADKGHSDLVVVDDIFELESNEKYLNWNNCTSNNIIDYIENNADKIRSKYLLFIYETGELQFEEKSVVEHLQIRPKFSFWWMSLLVEKSNYAKSKWINDAVKLIALDDFLKNKDYSRVVLESSSKTLAKSMKMLCDKVDLEFTHNSILKSKSNESVARIVYRKLPMLMQSTMWVTRYLISRWKFKGVGVKEWSNSKANLTFVSYLFNLDIISASKGVYNSNYWTELVDLLRKNSISSNWLHLYVKSDLLRKSESSIDILKEFNQSEKNKQIHVTLDSFLSFGILFDALKFYFFLYCKTMIIRKVIRKNNSYIYPLIAQDINNSFSGPVCVSNIFYFLLFEKAMSMLPRQRMGVYLQENQGWEFGFLNAWYASGHNDKLIGFPHSTITFWNLMHFFDVRSYESKALSLPRPNYVAVSGRYMEKLYIEGGYPVDELIQVEALRYLYLNKEVKNRKINLNEKRSILVLGDSEKNNTLYLMSLLEKSNKKKETDIRYMVKPHPLCPIRSNDYPSLKMTVSNRPISELINECFMSLTANVTSAAVDVYCAGKKVITVLDEKSLNLSPLKGCNDVSFVSTPDKLADIINGIGKVEVNHDQGKGYFYLDADLPRWRGLLLDDSKAEKR